MSASRWSVVKSRISDLIARYRVLQTENVRKDGQIESLEIEKQNAENRVRELEEMLLLKDSTLQVQKNTINELTEQNKLIKLAKEMSTEKGDTHELKIKINELIRDIDRCIDLLNDLILWNLTKPYFLL